MDKNLSEQLSREGIKTCGFEGGDMMIFSSSEQVIISKVDNWAGGGCSGIWMLTGFSPGSGGQMMKFQDISSVNPYSSV